MKKIKIITFYLFVLFLFVSCNDGKKENKNLIYLATWNVQNLFNGKDDGNEYSEYKLSSGWSDKYYRLKLNTISDVLAYDNLFNSDILVLNEVENESVLEDLLNTKKLKNNWKYYVMAGELTGAIKIAIVSKIPIINAFVHAVEGARPVLQADFNSSIGIISVLAIHAKSNLNDEIANIEKRDNLGIVLDKIYRKIKIEDPKRIIVIMGDFNENVEDMHVIKNPSFWDVSWDHVNDDKSLHGSYCYNGEWFKYDNILLSIPLIKDSGVILDGITTTLEGIPNAYNRRLLSGASDHLPVWAIIHCSSHFILD